MVTQEFILETINKNIEAREQEVFGYQFNIDNYEAMIARLPVATEALPSDPLLAARHGLRDDLAQRVLAERIQLQTAQLVLDVLIARREQQT